MRFETNIVSGYGRGKFLGYPTLNLVIPEDFSYSFGIYAGYVWLDEHKMLGAFHYGPVPTYSQKDPSLEVFVLDADIEHAPQKIAFSLERKIRQIALFKTEAELIEQITNDVAQTKKILANI